VDKDGMTMIKMVRQINTRDLFSCLTGQVTVDAQREERDIPTCWERPKSLREFTKSTAYLVRHR